MKKGKAEKGPNKGNQRRERAGEREQKLWERKCAGNSFFLSPCHRFGSHQLHLLFSALHAVPSSAGPKGLPARQQISLFFSSLFFPLRRPPSLFPPFLCPLVVPLLYLFPFTGEEDDARPGNDVSLTAAKTTRSVGVMVGTACLLSPPAGRKRYFNNWDPGTGTWTMRARDSKSRAETF